MAGKVPAPDKYGYPLSMALSNAYGKVLVMNLVDDTIFETF